MSEPIAVFIRRTSRLIRVGSVLLLASFVLLACTSDPAPTPDAERDLVPTATPATTTGAQIFAARCQMCHQSDGRGIDGQFPPLAGSSIVVGPKARPIAILLHGLTGPVEVAGATYDGDMPRLYGASDASIAAVLTYVRTNWGNDADAVTEDEVQRVRAAVASRTEPWTWPEIDALPDALQGSDETVPATQAATTPSP